VPDPASRPTNEVSSTRQRLLEAAYQVLVDEGYQAATVQSIARRANLTTGAIYANFANKHELLVLAALDRWYAHGLTSMLAEPGADDVVEVMVEHLSAAPAPEHRLLTEVTGAALRDHAGEHLLRSAAQQIAVITRAAIDRAKAEGTVDDRLPTDAWVALGVNLFLGAITSKSFGFPQPAPDEVRELLASFLRPWRRDPEA
jgi:AcrR family transcriptional regulator